MEHTCKQIINTYALRLGLESRNISDSLHDYRQAVAMGLTNIFLQYEKNTVERTRLAVGYVLDPSELVIAEGEDMPLESRHEK
jgi:hypothetical protein